ARPGGGLDQGGGAARDAAIDVGRAQPFAQCRFAGGVGDHGGFRTEAFAQRGQRVDAAMRGQRADAETVRMARDHVQRARADRTGCAEDRDRPHVGVKRSSSALPATNTGIAENTLSTRSSNPPWPGNSAPESFTLACRLSRLSTRSPRIEASTVSRATTITPARAAPRAPSSQPPANATAPATTSAPHAPARVLFGLTRGASLVVPKRLPAK